MTPETIPNNGEWVYFALDAKGYESLSLTQAEVIRWMREAMWRLEYYKRQSEGDEN